MKLKLARLEMTHAVTGFRSPSDCISPSVYLRFGEKFFWLKWTKNDEHSANDKM